MQWNNNFTERMFYNTFLIKHYSFFDNDLLTFVLLYIQEKSKAFYPLLTFLYVFEKRLC